jgi:hypothetical protein
MSDANMRLIDAEPTDPFDVFADYCKDPLVVGYSN